MTTLTFGSLFAGIGGMDLGLERTGMHVKWQVEIDPYCQRVLAKHWPDVARFRDVRDVGAHNLAPVDVIAGGFPCQDISVAGRGAGITGARSGLWSEFARIIGELRPRYVIVENVAALLGRGMGTVLGDLSTLGYDAEWEVIPALAVGAPHRRDRVFIVAYARGERRRQDARGASGDEGTDEGRAAQDDYKLDGNGQGNRARALADANIPRLAQREGERRNTEPQQSAAQRGGCGAGADVANATRSGSGALRAKVYQPQRASWIGRSGELGLADQWAIEPAVGRVADGVSFGLEFSGGRVDEQGNDQEANTAACFTNWQVLRAVWQHRAIAASSPRIFRERLSDIVPEVSRASGFARWVTQAQADEELRHLWDSFYALSFEEAQHLQQDLLERARAEERRQTLAFKRQRVNRLRGLGNAVVPQVAEFVGRCVMAHAGYVPIGPHLAIYDPAHTAPGGYCAPKETR